MANPEPIVCRRCAVISRGIVGHCPHVLELIKVERERCAKVAAAHDIRTLCVNGFSLHGTNCMVSGGSCQDSIAATIRDNGERCTAHERCRENNASS